MLVCASVDPVGVLETIVGLAGGAVIVVVLAAAARWLLGLRVGMVRTFVAGLAGYAIAALVGLAAGSRHHGRIVTPPVLLPVLVGVFLVATMLLLGLAEAVVPSGSRPRPVRALRRRLARARRYSQVTAIAVRHGLGPYLRGRGRAAGAGGAESRAALARSARLALAEGGVTFIKLGQLLSTRRDLLGAEAVQELGRLQHQAAPAPPEQVAALLTEELGAPPDAVFAAFDAVPLAAASVAQVHLARLHSGEEVVVKVQRPGIESMVEGDLDIVLSLARSIERRAYRGTTALDTISPPARMLNVLELAEGFAAALREELDFRGEARNAAAIAAAIGDGAATIHVPTVHTELSTQRVLVLERLAGVPLGVASATIDERGLDRVGLARALLQCFLGQIVIDGVFHADPHPGNVILLDDDRLGLLDFGSVGRLDAQLRDSLSRLLRGVNSGDPAEVSDALLELAHRPDELDDARLERELGRFIARHLGAGAAPGVEMFTDLFRLLARHGLVVAPEVAAVFRSLATLEGTLAQLAPGFDLIAEARTFAAGELAARLAPRAAGRATADELASLWPLLRRLPRRVDRITAALQEGRVGVGVRLFADQRDRRVITILLHQVLLAFLGAATGLMGAILLASSGGPRIASGLTLLALLGYILLLVGFVLILRVLVIILAPER